MEDNLQELQDYEELQRSSNLKVIIVPGLNTNEVREIISINGISKQIIVNYVPSIAIAPLTPVMINHTQQFLHSSTLPQSVT